MQLAKFFSSYFLILVSLSTFAQDVETQIEENNLWLKKTALTNVQINILGSYYSQDGNHSAVTGGLGTEDLTDITPAVVVLIPVGLTQQWSFNAGADFITSASTDNIDFNVSSASKNDLRTHIDVTYSKRLANHRITYSISGGLSNEYDVFSNSIGASVTKETRNGNSVLTLNGQVFFDTWSIITPIELRSTTIDDSNNKRTSYNFGLMYSQVLSKRLQVSFSAELISQSGLLSTPFHRVFFNDGVNVDGFTTQEILKSNKLRLVENLPQSRTRIPLSVRVNYYISDLLIFRGYYRYYSDNFDIKSHTISVDLPIKISPYISITPFYRYNTQTASKYFKPFGEHEINSEFFSSDYDQSSLNTNKYGIGIRYSPLYQIGTFKTPFTRKAKNKFTHFKAIELRAASFERSDGLNAFIISFDLSFDLVTAIQK